jgi:hypothetical protein
MNFEYGKKIIISLKESYNAFAYITFWIFQVVDFVNCAMLKEITIKN